MYCVNCGVKMDDGVSRCPLCGAEFAPYRLQAGVPAAARPSGRKLSRDGVFIVITVAALLVIATVLAIDLSFDGRLSWAGYVTGVIILCYMGAVFPLWLRSADRLVIIAAEYAAIILYLLGLELTVGGGWYFPVALPSLLLLCLISLLIATLAKRYPTRALMIAGVAWLMIGSVALVMELLGHRAFGGTALVWSPWVMLGCAAVGGALIVIALCEPLRERIIKRMFI